MGEYGQLLATAARKPMMRRPAFLELFERYRDGALTITGPGLATRQLYAIVGEDPSILYNMEMQYATPLCLGLALARPGQRIVALEGDGSFISGIGVLTTLARYKVPNLTVIILDNESYATFGRAEIKSATAEGLDLEAVSRSCGISKAATICTLEAAEETVPRAMTEAGPWVVIAKVEAEGDTDASFARNSPDVIDQGIAFYQFLRRQKGATA
jgi:thiamine pyrophosphate-dependent acetolactate synthase large subunit-like protein